MNTSYNFNNLIDRAKYCAELAGNPSRLAAETGMSRSNIWRIVEGGADMTTESACRIAKAVGVDVGWLVSGEGSPHPHGERHPKLISIRCIEPDCWCPVLFQEQHFLDSISVAPKHCRAFKMVDPEIKSIQHGAWCVIDESQTSTLNGFYLIHANGVDQVRVLEFIPTGAIRVRSETQFTEYTLSKEEVDSIEIRGRVVWWESRE